MHAGLSVGKVMDHLRNHKRILQPKPLRRDIPQRYPHLVTSGIYRVDLIALACFMYHEALASRHTKFSLFRLCAKEASASGELL